MIIDLRSDTVTQPSAGMKEYMFNAPLGDDVFGEDPSVLALEEKAAKMFGMEAAIFCPSGTMTNQIAIKVHTQPLDEVICDKLSHIYLYELGGYAFNSAVSVQILDGDRGRINPDQVIKAIKPEADWYPNSSLLVVENTCNKGGGSCYSLEQLQALQKVCKEKDLKFHLDGARLMNAVVKTGISTAEFGALFDSISLCISKGLGAPVGSVLIGEQKDIKKARKIRKVLGGGMRQAGILAAACTYALENNVESLKEDHRRATAIGELLLGCDYIEKLYPVETNILIFQLKKEMPGPDFIEKLAENHIKAVEFGPQLVRMVTHLDFTDEMLEKTLTVLSEIAID